MANPWVEYVKSYASKNGITYGCALSTPGLNVKYRSGEEPMAEQKMKKPRKGKKLIVEE